MIVKIVAVVESVRLRATIILFRSISFVHKLIMRAKKAPAPPASLGLKMPPHMPPSMTTANSSMGHISLTATSFSRHENIRSEEPAREGLMVTQIQTVHIISAASKMPGKKPDKILLYLVRIVLFRKTKPYRQPPDMSIHCYSVSTPERMMDDDICRFSPDPG